MSERPAIEERSRPYRPWLTRGDLVFGIVVGVILAAVLVAVMPDVRQHMFGGTELRETTVIGVDVGTRSGESDRVVTDYVLRWTDNGSAHATTFKRTGPPKREVGETWELWVSDDGTSVETESPLLTWLWLGLGMPVMSVLLAAMWNLRQRILVRQTLRDIERRDARRARKDAAGERQS